MIEVSELRTGNLVKCKISNDSGIYKVVAIDGYHNKVMLDGARFREWILEEKLKPIALTPEILQSAGFEDWGEEVVNEWETCHYYVLYNVIEGTSSIKVCFINGNYGLSGPYSEWVFKIDNDTIYNKGLEYLHQLQNVVFALTHQELTINLQTITKCHTPKITNS